MSVQLAYPNSGISSVGRKLTEEDFDPLCKKIEPEMRNLYRTEIAPMFAKLGEINKEKLDLQAKATRFDQEIAEAKEMKAQGLQGLKEVALKEQALSQREQALAKKKQDVLTNMFYGIFHGKTPLSTDVTNALFQKYLTDGSLTMEISPERKSFARINSMKAITTYLDNNPNVTKCNFLSFNTEVHDIPTLAEYLSKATYKITIILNKNISDSAKTSLTDTIGIRKGGLEVKYI